MNNYTQNQEGKKMAEVISAHELEFAYSSIDEEGNSVLGDKVIDNITLHIEEGSFVAILGHNGSGKSTLAKNMNAILLPTGGKMYVCDMDTADEDNLFDIRSQVGMVFQNPDNQLVATIVEEDVAFALENLGVEPIEIRKRVDEALKAVGMYEYRTHSAHQLSGGQKQRVAVAGVIAMKPRCIVLDEPTAMLDPKGRREVLETIKRLNRENKITVVLITHYMDEAAKADRIVVMDKGKLILDGAPREVFSNVELIRKIGLDVPQATELSYILQNNGYEISEKILNEDEIVNTIINLNK